MQKTLLIVDDEPAIVAALRRVLRNRGFNLLTANSAQEALDVMQHSEVCVVLTDYQMPQMNGLQLLKQIALQWPQTKRLMLTGNNDSAEALKSEAGKVSTELASKLAPEKEIDSRADVIHQVLSKPWSTEQLTKALEQAFSCETETAVKDTASVNSQSTSHLDSQNANRAQRTDSGVDQLIDYQAIEQLVADVSESMFPELACLFVESTEQRLDQLEQVDKQPLKSAVSKEIRLQLHTLASSMALYGLTHSAQSARYLEKATDSEVDQQLSAFCEKARVSLSAFNQQLIKRTQNKT